MYRDIGGKWGRLVWGPDLIARGGGQNQESYKATMTTKDQFQPAINSVCFSSMSKHLLDLLLKISTKA